MVSTGTCNIHIQSSNRIKTYTSCYENEGDHIYYHKECTNYFLHDNGPYKYLYKHKFIVDFNNVTSYNFSKINEVHTPLFADSKQYNCVQYRGRIYEGRSICPKSEYSF